jgi:hypothetical protein
VRVYDGGSQKVPSSFPVAILRVLREDNQEIFHASPDKMDEDDAL